MVFFYRNRKRHSSYSSTCDPDSLRSRVVLTLLAQKNWDVHVFLQRSDIGREVNDIWNHHQNSPWGSGLKKVPRVSWLSHRAIKWGGPSDETAKTEAPCIGRCGTIKIPQCSQAVKAEHMPNFGSGLSLIMVTSPYQCNISKPVMF